MKRREETEAVRVIRREMTSKRIFQNLHVVDLTTNYYKLNKKDILGP